MLAISTIFLASCERPPEIHTLTGFAQGTTYSVKFWHSDDQPIDNSALKQAIDKELSRIDKLMSNYRDDSDIARFNQNKTANAAIAVDTEILNLLKIAAEVHQKSQGCYDPTIGPLFALWGFKKDHFYQPSTEEIANALTAVGFSSKLKITDSAITKLNKNTTIDLSAIGQGYAVEQISALLNQQGITNYLTEIGGEMLVSGTKPKGQKWRVGVERPVPNSQKISETIVVEGDKPAAIMTSGTYRHYFDNKGKRYSHILDPRTGSPIAHDSVAVTVQYDNATYADAWSTALLCLGSEKGLPIAKKHRIKATYYDLIDNEIVKIK